MSSKSLSGRGIEIINIRIRRSTLKRALIFKIIDSALQYCIFRTQNISIPEIIATEQPPIGCFLHPQIPLIPPPEKLLWTLRQQPPHQHLLILLRQLHPLPIHLLLFHQLILTDIPQILLQHPPALLYQQRLPRPFLWVHHIRSIR